MPTVPKYCPCCLSELTYISKTRMYFCPDWFVCNFESGDDGKPDAFGQVPLTWEQCKTEYHRRRQQGTHQRPAPKKKFHSKQ